MYEHQIIHTLFQVLNHCARYFFRLHVQFICQPEIDRRETVRTQTNARLTGTVITEPPRPVVSQLPPGKELTPDHSRIFKVQNYSPEWLFLLSHNPRAYSPIWSLLVSQIGHPTPPRSSPPWPCRGGVPGAAGSPDYQRCSRVTVGTHANSLS